MQLIATAREWADGWREVSYWSGFFDGSHVSIMLTLTGLLDTGRSADPSRGRAPRAAAVTERLVRITTALTVIAVADVAAVIS